MKPTMTHVLIRAASVSAVASSLAWSQPMVAFDSDDNYASGPGWQSGSNGGFGFGPWTITKSGYEAFAFIGDPAQAGITGMEGGFGLMASGEGSAVTASRPFAAPLQVGQTFSLQWGTNFPATSYDVAGRTKGFTLMAGATEVVRVEDTAYYQVTFNGSNTGLGFGLAAMTWSFTYLDADTLAVSATGRTGSESFSTQIAVPGGISAFSIHASEFEYSFLQRRESYYNNFTILPAAVPPVSAAELKAPSIALDGGNLLFTVDPVVPGRRYQLQQSTILDGTWQNIGAEQTATGPPVLISIPFDPEIPRCFYRIALDPASN